MVGERYSCSVSRELPGGACALFDLEADPGETFDVQAKFPNITWRMANGCRQRWEAVITSGRSFFPSTDEERRRPKENAE